MGKRWNVSAPLTLLCQAQGSQSNINQEGWEFLLEMNKNCVRKLPPILACSVRICWQTWNRNIPCSCSITGLIRVQTLLGVCGACEHGHFNIQRNEITGAHAGSVFLGRWHKTQANTQSQNNSASPWNARIRKTNGKTAHARTHWPVFLFVQVAVGGNTVIQF